MAEQPPVAPKRPVAGEKLRGADKVARIPVKIEPTTSATRLKKPEWIRARFRHAGGTATERHPARESSAHRL